MKNLNVIFEDSEFNDLKKSQEKSGKVWRLFVLDMLRAWRDEKRYQNDNK